MLRPSLCRSRPAKCTRASSHTWRKCRRRHRTIRLVSPRSNLCPSRTWNRRTLPRRHRGKRRCDIGLLPSVSHKMPTSKDPTRSSSLLGRRRSALCGPGAPYSSHPLHQPHGQRANRHAMRVRAPQSAAPRSCPDLTPGWASPPATPMDRIGWRSSDPVGKARR